MWTVNEHQTGRIQSHSQGKVVGSLLAAAPAVLGRLAVVFAVERREPVLGRGSQHMGAPGAGHHLHGLLGEPSLAEAEGGRKDKEAGVTAEEEGSRVWRIAAVTL